MTTRKDFVLIAEAVAACKPNDPSESPDYKRGVYAVANELAWQLGKTNPRFDRERFLKACGVQS